jgi:peptidoglycan/xylan/chitin deacetylase (PgdA/CDA1 family)
MKSFVYALLYLTGVVRLASWLNRRRVAILCYHGVTKRSERSPRDPDGLFVREDRFARQLDYLKPRYHVISLEAYLKARHEGKQLPPYSVVLTFDDGYRNFLTVAARQLAARQMPASVFLITDRLREEDGLGQDLNWSEADDDRCLSWTEAQSLQQSQSIEFGSHTCSHPKLSTLMPAEAERELNASRLLVIGQLGRPYPPFAYPFGDYSEALARRANDLGYTCALTTDEGMNDENTDLFKLRRTLIGDADEKAAFAVRVSGILGWLKKGGSHEPGSKLSSGGANA